MANINKTIILTQSGSVYYGTLAEQSAESKGAVLLDATYLGDLVQDFRSDLNDVVQLAYHGPSDGPVITSMPILQVYDMRALFGCTEAAVKMFHEPIA